MIWHTVESIPYLSVEMACLVNLSGNFGPLCFKKNLNASEPSEHPLSKEKKYTVGGNYFWPQGRKLSMGFKRSIIVSMLRVVST